MGGFSSPLSSPGKTGFVLRSILFAKPVPRGGKGEGLTSIAFINAADVGGWGNVYDHHERPTTACKVHDRGVQNNAGENDARWTKRVLRFGI